MPLKKKRSKKRVRARRAPSFASKPLAPSKQSSKSRRVQTGLVPLAPGPVTNVSTPKFAEPVYSTNATEFVDTASDRQYLSQLGTTTPLPVPPPTRADLTPENLAIDLEDVWSGVDAERLASSIDKKRIVFHAVGDTGPIHSPGTLTAVVERMLSDFKGELPEDVPAFCYHLGDVVYYFGESEYYYDQFYEPFHDYGAPIFAIPGNHDGIVYSGDKEKSLDAFIRNFCAPSWQKTTESGNLQRTAMTQPAVYFRLDATPLVKVIGLYSNVLEHFGVISDQGNAQWKVGSSQTAFLTAQLTKLKKEEFQGAVIIAVHHPPFTSNSAKSSSPEMLKDIDTACEAAQFWPHAVLSGHAHNYQRFTRVDSGRETPYVVCGCSGHNPLQAFKSTKGGTSVRTPASQKPGPFGSIRLENRLEKYGYLRVVVTSTMLSIEFYDIDTATGAKSPVDVVNVNLTTRKLVAQRP